MNTTKTLLLAATCAGLGSANAAITQWQLAVGTGTTASATQFTTVSTPETINVGTTAGTAMSFEFLVNASGSGVASALLGDRNTPSNNQQSIRFEQYNNTGNYGITEFGGFGDVNSGVALTDSVTTHLMFTTDGTDTLLYVNGSLEHTFAGNAINISGVTGLGGDDRNGSFTDALPGTILGFAAYDSQVGAGEVLTHANAFSAVPEPSSTALLGLGGLALILRRRK